VTNEKRNAMIIQLIRDFDKKISDMPPNEQNIFCREWIKI